MLRVDRVPGKVWWLVVLKQSNRPSLSVIILTWNSKHYVVDCLPSVLKACNKLESYEVLIVDNGSSDGTLELVEHYRKSYPSIHLIPNGRNLGIAPARNIGILKSAGRYVLLLDVDTVVNEDCFINALEHMERDDSIGLLGCKIYYPDNSVQPSCLAFPNVLLPVFRRVHVLSNTSAGRKWLRRHLMSDFDHTWTRDVDYVIGAFQLIRRTTIELAGLLDNNMFYGNEDLEYCIRVWKHGKRVVYFPASSVTHYQQRLGAKSLRAGLIQLKTFIYLMTKYRFVFRTDGLRKPVREGFHESGSTIRGGRGIT